MRSVRSGPMEGRPSAAASTTEVNEGLNPNVPAPFLSKTYDMVDDPETDAILSWGPQNNSFVVWDQSEFSRELIPKHFKHKNFSSFVRQLNTYGFRKVDPDRWEFANEGFLRGQKHLLKNIVRRRPSHGSSQVQQTQPQDPPVSACVEVGKFGLEEEVERLKRDKNVLMQELIRLRQQQQASDNLLQTLGKRLQGMERRQQMMMSFLAKAMQSPGLLAQLVRQNKSNRRIIDVNKKRRLTEQKRNSMEGKSASTTGQIVRYQPLMNDSAAAMLKQLMEFESSVELAPAMDNISSPRKAANEVAHAVNGAAHAANEVTLAEVPQNLDIPPFLPISSGISTACSTSAASDEFQSEAVLAGITMPNILPDASMLSSIPADISSEFPEMQGMISDGIADDIPIENFVLPDSERMYFNHIDNQEDDLWPMEGTDDEQKLSDIMDSLLEEFISPSPQSEGNLEVVSSAQEGTDMLQASSGSRCENALNMDNIIAQRGVLASDSRG